MVMCEMSLDRFVELLIGATGELCPTLAVGNPTLPFDHRHLA